MIGKVGRWVRVLGTKKVDRDYLANVIIIVIVVVAVYTVRPGDLIRNCEELGWSKMEHVERDVDEIVLEREDGGFSIWTVSARVKD